MVTLLVILTFVAILVGMAISVFAFGTGGKRANIFKDIYYSVENVDGIGIIYTKTGEYSAILKMENPIQKYSADIDSYYEFNSLMTSVLQTLGEGYAIHKQDIFVRKEFSMRKEMESIKGSEDERFLTTAYFKYFDGRKYMANMTYVVITQENKKSSLMSHDNNKWKDFLVKIHKVQDQLVQGQVRATFLTVGEVREHIDKYFTVNFQDGNVSMTNYKVDSEGICMGDRQMKIYSLLDVEEVHLPGRLKPYEEMAVNNSVMPVDLMSHIDSITDADTIIYNQILFIPPQVKELNNLEKKRKRSGSMPNPGNQLISEDISNVQAVIAKESKQLVYAHFNLIVETSAKTDMQKVTNYIENIFSRQNIHISKRAYNQLELFVASFPGNCYQLNSDYDRFLTLSDAALCMMYKEHQSKGDKSPLKCYYTDRQGVPMVVDLTGKEGETKYTTNSNFFVLGPSGSGKSFFMNTVGRQYLEQDTDVVIVDTGDSYEGLNSNFNGTYISYSKEKPISMNPFKVSVVEYKENFNEKKGFLKSLIFLIFKGSEMPSKIEDTIINQVIVEYYREYFTPFKGFTDQDKKEMREKLLLQDKKNGKYDRYERTMEEKYGEDYRIDELEEQKRREKLVRKTEKLEALANDEGASEGEKEAATRQLQRLTPELLESKYMMRIEKEIEKIEHQRKSIKVKELNFNSFYEFAIERIPQITQENNITFPIDDFAAILGTFYKGGELEYTLNNDMDSTLFDEKFIVFEIDKVKDDPVLFPIIVLIIMDVFTQKMRIKKNRKCLVIEEAWKAIATPVMAEYIKYLYKTARKHWAMVGVVTQEIQDITSSPIVKEAIINNSDVFMLLDQSKFKEKFDDIKATLALTDTDCKKIFTINKLDNKENRSAFMEVFIKRGNYGEVYGIEEPRECYMCYTTEKIEKEALKLYRRELKCSNAKAIEAYVNDWNEYERQKKTPVKPIKFAQEVNKAGHVLNLTKIV